MQLPDFLEALESSELSQPEREATSRVSGYSDTPNPSQQRSSQQKLRYAAYEQPKPPTSPWRTRSSGSVHSNTTPSSPHRNVHNITPSQEAAETVSMSLAAVSLGLDSLKRVTSDPGSAPPSAPDVCDFFEGVFFFSWNRRLLTDTFSLSFV